ncbi:AraC-type DNA-binding protein [Rhizobiales bacterium GAS113]|nr:AraC-type DNA-binding protein [Rhizobiales bacterium GAS113]
MTNSWRILAEGSGFRVTDFCCRAGPEDEPFEERHGCACIALVTRGTFNYRSTLGSASLAPGSILLGDGGHCFECGHEYGRGDSCIAFHFTPQTLESVVTSLPGATRLGFGRAHLPPLQSLVALSSRAEAASLDADPAEWEEIALSLAAQVIATLRHTRPHHSAPSARDQRRVAEALRRIESGFDAEITLQDLAHEAQMSPFHFLRVFRDCIGMTPHQFVLRTRLQRSAVELRSSDRPVSSIAFDMGFGDLSSFNRRFRRLMGANPTEWRAQAGRRWAEDHRGAPQAALKSLT